MTYSPSHSPTSPTDLGLLLRGHRRAAGLTQEELAEKAGMSARAVSDIERGLRTGVYRDTAERLATALGLAGSDRESFITAARRSPAPVRLAPLLPLPPSPLLGRDRELERLLQLVEDPITRLVTLTGPPGVGKSRLALEAAHVLRPLTSGTWFVQLAPVQTTEAVPSAVLNALELPDTGDQLQGLARRLPAGAVLVLDNFEHLLEAAPWVAELLTAAPSSTVVTTSRAPLRLRLETELRLAPLADPAALDLFKDRVGSVGGERQWTPEELGLARRVCARLDRLPLALELAAASLNHLTLASLAEGLDGHLNLLGEGWRDMPERHRSMEAAVSWSLELLAPADRDLLLALAVFAGSFGIGAVVGVTGLEDEVAVRRLGRLVEQNLVQLAAPLRGAPRYQLLEVIRQVAGRQAAAAGALAEHRSRHLDHHVRLAEVAEPHLHAAGRGEWTERLDADMANLEAALNFAAQTGDADRGLRLATALWRWWRMRGALNSGRAHFRRLLALPGGTPPVRMRALWGASWLALHQQDKEESRRLSEELLDLAAAAGDGLARRNALTGLGMVARYEGRPEAALPLFQEALEVARQAGDRWILATSIFNVGQPLLETGSLAEGEALLEDARARYLELGDTGFAARMIVYRARSALLQGEAGRASRHVLDAAETFRELEEPWGQIECLETAAAILALRGVDLPAATALGAAAAAHELLGSAQLVPDALMVRPILNAARARAGTGWDAAQIAGAQLSLASALEDALTELGALV